MHQIHDRKLEEAWCKRQIKGFVNVNKFVITVRGSCKRQSCVPGSAMGSVHRALLSANSSRNWNLQTTSLRLFLSKTLKWQVLVHRNAISGWSHPCIELNECHHNLGGIIERHECNGIMIAEFLVEGSLNLKARNMLVPRRICGVLLCCCCARISNARCIYFIATLGSELLLLPLFAHFDLLWAHVMLSYKSKLI